MWLCYWSDPHIPLQKSSPGKLKHREQWSYKYIYLRGTIRFVLKLWHWRQRNNRAIYCLRDREISYYFPMDYFLQDTSHWHFCLSIANWFSPVWLVMRVTNHEDEAIYQPLKKLHELTHFIFSFIPFFPFSLAETWINFLQGSKMKSRYRFGGFRFQH